MFKSAIISSAAENCGKKQLRLAGDNEKRTPRWKPEVKQAIRAKKDAFKALLQDKSLFNLQFRYTERAKSGNFGSKEIQGEAIERIWVLVGFQQFSATKVIWQTIRRLQGKRSSITYSIKDSADCILTDENEIFSR